MRRVLRSLINKAFTTSAGFAVLLMATALVVILGPMLYRGATAVVFQSTVEFRKMQLREKVFDRGEPDEVQAEEKQTNEARQPVYDILDGPFNYVIDPDPLVRKVRREVYKELKTDLRNRVDAGTLDEDTYDRLRKDARKLRDALEESYQAEDNAAAREALAYVLEYDKADRFKGTRGEQFFTMAQEWMGLIKAVNLSQRDTYKKSWEKVKLAVYRLFGPRPGQKIRSDLPIDQYGATRWDKAQEFLHVLLWEERFVAGGEGGWQKKVLVSRKEFYQGTPVAELFDLVERDLDKMLHPEWTFYWQYFIDDSVYSHYYGGVGPELLGTLALTVLTMIVAVPIGVMTAAYLAECAGDNMFVRFIRMCINTLAGVPSIVFGLFGLAFFLSELQPMLGMDTQRTVFAGAMTLGVLVLPIMIRASEEAIRAVPPSYKEASLALGAGGLRTFLTVTFPAALPGILTGTILSMSRAAGEVAPILFTAAVATSSEFFPSSFFDGGVRALSFGSHQIATADAIGQEVPHQQYGMIMTLILLVLILNVTAIIIRSRVSRKLRGQ